MDLDKIILHYATFFKSLMTTPIKIYHLARTTSVYGTPSVVKELYAETLCNFHSISIDRAEFRDKVGSKSVYMVCLPLSLVFDDSDYVFEIDNKEFQLIGIRQASRRFENVCEVVDYE